MRRREHHYHSHHHPPFQNQVLLKTIKTNQLKYKGLPCCKGMKSRSLEYPQLCMDEDEGHLTEEEKWN